MITPAKVLPIVCLVALAVPPARAENGQALAEEIISRCRTDADCTARLFAAAQAAQGDEQIVLLQKTVEYGLKVPNYPDCRAAVLQAIDLLDAKAPDRKAQWLTRRLDLYRGWYRLAWDDSQRQAAGGKLVELQAQIGDRCEKGGAWAEAAAAYQEAHTLAASLALPSKQELSEKFLRATSAYAAEVRVRECSERLGKNPGDVQTRVLLLTLLTADLDDPARAAKCLRPDVGPIWNARVPLAAKVLDDLDAPACQTLAEWYDRDLRKRTSSPQALRNVLNRAEMYYARCLSLRGEGEQDVLTLRSSLNRIRAELKKLAEPPPVVVAAPVPATPSRPGFPSGKSGESGDKDVLTFGGHRYKVIRDRMDWNEARAACEKMGGHLACAETKEEIDFLKKIAGGRRLWVGASDEQVEGAWRWINGGNVPMDNSFWEDREPNGGREQNYATIMRDGLKDTASPYKSVEGFICEWDN